MRLNIPAHLPSSFPSTIMTADSAPFALARQVGHLIVQPADDALNPPESYLFVQDGLIILCGGLYALCYLFCMTQTISDKKYPGSELGGIQFLYALPISR